MGPYKRLECKDQIALLRALKKYGFNAFKIDFFPYPEDMLDWAEKTLIAAYGSFGGGYNMTSGGNRGYKMADETKKKISEARKGITFSDETKEKLRQANLGKKHSDDTKKKIGDAHKGMKRSDEARANISAGHKGKKVSLETRMKQSIAKIGTKHSEESKRKMSEAVRNTDYAHVKGENNYMWKGGDERLCPNCGINNVVIYKTGYVGGYCKECVSVIQKEAYQAKKMRK